MTAATEIIHIHDVVRHQSLVSCPSTFSVGVKQMSCRRLVGEREGGQSYKHREVDSQEDYITAACTSHLSLSDGQTCRTQNSESEANISHFVGLF